VKRGQVVPRLAETKGEYRGKKAARNHKNQGARSEGRRKSSYQEKKMATRGGPNQKEGNEEKIQEYGKETVEEPEEANTKQT